jgi:hypothetical protein
MVGSCGRKLVRAPACRPLSTDRGSLSLTEHHGTRRLRHRRRPTRQVRHAAVTCDKCGRGGRYSVRRLALEHGRDGRLTDWLSDVTKDCPRKASPGLADPCGAQIPDLLRRDGDPEGPRPRRTPGARWPPPWIAARAISGREITIAQSSNSMRQSGSHCAGARDEGAFVPPQANGSPPWRVRLKSA